MLDIGLGQLLTFHDCVLVLASTASNQGFKDKVELVKSDRRGNDVRK